MKKLIAAAACLAVINAFAQQPPESALNRQPIDGIDNAKTPAAQVKKAEADKAKKTAPAKDQKKEQKKAEVKKAVSDESVKQPRVDAAVMSADPNKATAQQKADAKAAISDLLEKSGGTQTIRLNKNTNITVKPGENVFIPIARSHINRILSPFKNPKVFSSSLSTGTKGDCGELCIRNGVIYVTTEARTAVSAFITEEGHEDIAYSITMIPQSIPPREVKFTFPETVMSELDIASNVANPEDAERWETEKPFNDMLTNSMRQIALGQIPQGYSLRKVNRRDELPVCKQDGLQFTFRPGQVLEGFHMNFFVGVIKNVSDRPVEFLESNCGGWNTSAVTSWPLKVLRPGQESEIYIAMKKAAQEVPEQTRRPLIKRVYN